MKVQIDYILETTHPENPAQEGSKRDGVVMSTFRQDVQATHDKVNAHDTAAACLQLRAIVCWWVGLSKKQNAGFLAIGWRHCPGEPPECNYCWPTAWPTVTSWLRW